MLNSQNTQGESRDAHPSTTKRDSSAHKRGRKSHRYTHNRPKEPAAQ